MIWELVKLPFRLLMALSKGMLVLLLVLALGLNLAVLTRQSVFGELSGWIEAVAPGVSVRARQARLLAAETARADSETQRARAAEAAAADLRERNQQLAQSNDALSATNTALKQQNDTLTQANSAMTAEIARLRPLAAQAQVVYQGRTIAARAAVAEATADLARRLEAAARFRRDTLAGAAIPFYGIALIAAEAHRSLEADCAQMRQLQALGAAFGVADGADPTVLCAAQAPAVSALWAEVGDTSTLWRRMGQHFDGLGAFTPPPWWQVVLGWGDLVVPHLPAASAKP